MSGYRCPFCSMVMALNNDTYRVQYPSSCTMESYRWC